MYLKKTHGISTATLFNSVIVIVSFSFLFFLAPIRLGYFAGKDQWKM